MKKYLLTLITLSLLLCEASFTGGGMAFATAISGTGLTWTTNGAGTILTIEYSGSGSSVMPDYGSTSNRAPWYTDYRTSVTEIVIKEGVTEIGSYAFNAFSNVTTVQIPPTIIGIHSSAFNSCSKINRVNFRRDDMGKDYATDGMLYRWAQIEFANSGANPLNSNGGDLYVAKVSGSSGCSMSKVTSFTSSNASSISNYAFYKCTSLQTITIAATTTSIGEYAFYGCSNIIKVTVNDGSQLASIGGRAFYNCTSLATFIFPNSLETIGTYAFNGNKFTEIIIPSSVQTIGERAFNNCASLTTINFDNASGLITIGPAAFYQTTALKSIDLRGATSLTTIGDGAFSYTSAMTSTVGYLYIPATVTSIGSKAFQNRTKLTGIVVLRSENTPISECTNADSYNCVPTSIPVYVDSEDLVSIYSSATGWSGFTNITSNKVLEWECGATTPSDLVAHLNVWTGALYFTGSGAMKDYDNSSNKAPWREYESVIKSIDFTNVTTIGARAFQQMTCLKGVLPLHSGITAIGTYAFYQCTELTDLDLGSLTSLASIGSNAFDGCNKISSVITLPASITTMSTYVFSGCTMLSRVTFADGWQLNTIPVRTFSGCSKLAGTITVPASVTSIGNYAFYGCSSITTLDMTQATSLSTIGTYAFSGCTSLDGVIVYPASMTSIGDYAFQSCSKVDGIVVKKSTTPIISAGSNTFKSMTSTIPVMIPTSALQTTYSSATGWSFFNSSMRTGTTISGSCGTNLTWTLDLETSTLTISGSGTTMTDYDNSSNKAPWRTYAGCIKTLITPASLQHIGNHAFRDCANMTDLNLSNNVSTIGTNAFYGCKGLTDITLPESITSIGTGVFSSCNNLAGVYYGGDIDDWCSIEFGDVWANPLRYAGKLYIENELVTTANITIANIKNYALTYNTELTTITLTNTETIGGSAFNQCPKLSGEIVFPNSLTSIGEHAFKDNPLISAITFAPDASLTTIGQTAFYGCLGLRTVILSENLEEIGNQAFYNQNATNIQTIYSYATTAPTFLGTGGKFYDNAYNNAILHIPASGYASYIGNSTWNSFLHKAVFGDCGASGDNVQFELDLTTGVLTISGSGAMANYADATAMPWNSFKSDIQSIVIGDGVTTIGNYAFYGCNNASFTSISIPQGVTSLGNSAFSGCSHLASVTLPSTLLSIGSSAFFSNALTSITIPNSVVSIGSTAFKGCSSLASISIGESSSLTTISNGAFENCISLTSITIPNSLTSISYDAFKGCSSLAAVNYGSAPTLATIGYSAFANCTSLTSIAIPESITTLTCNNGDHAYPIFSGCTSLISVVWNARNCGGFSRCGQYQEYAMPFESIKAQITSFTFGNNVLRVPAYVCHGMTNLASVTIPSSVTLIGDYAFDGCTGITSVTSNAVNPPTIASNSFPASVKSSAPLTLVSCESKADYLEDANWNFATIYPNKVDFNLKEHGSAISSQCIEEPETPSVPSPAPSETGYTFGGWYDNEECTGEAFDFSSEITADLTLYAKWTINSYDVTFNMQGHGTQTPAQSINYNGTVSEPSAPSETGYTFGGWFKEAGCINAWDFSNDHITTATTLFAQWTINNYDVTFNMQGHGSSIAVQSVNYNGLVSEPSDPEADYYTFGGWYKEAGCANAWDFSEDQVTDDLTLYAKWTLNGLALDENNNNNSLIAAYNGQTTNVTMTRSLTNAQYNTFCLPFNLSADQMAEAFGAGYDLEELTGVTYDGESLALEFTQREALVAGKPYLLQPANNAVNPSFTSVTIDASSPSDGLNNAYIEYRGVYSPASLEGGNHNLLFLGAGNELFWPASNGNLKGFRAYFIVKSPALGAMRARIVKKEDSATGIDCIQPSAVSSQKYIKDGILYIERDGKTFNAQGQRIK